MPILFQDLRFSLRTLLRNRGFSSIAVLTIALGIGANTAIFSVVKGVLINPLPFPDQDRLVIVWTTLLKDGIRKMRVSPRDFEDWSEKSRVFDASAVFDTHSGTLKGPESPERIRYTRVTPGFFRTLGFSPALGRVFHDDDNRPGAEQVAILSNAFWRTHFSGDSGVLGRSFFLDGEPQIVIGVMPPGVDFPSSEIKMWKPFGMPMSDFGHRANYMFGAVARLKQGITISIAQEDMDSIMAGLAQQHPTNQGVGALVEPLHEVVAGSARPGLLVLWGTTGLLLLIVCINVANLLLGRVAARSREIAVRASLGAGSARIARQLLTESVVLSLIGGAVGLLLSLGAVRWLLSLSQGTIPRVHEVGIDLSVLDSACFSPR